MGPVAVIIVTARRELLTFRLSRSQPGSAFNKTAFKSSFQKIIRKLGSCVQNCNLNRLRAIHEVDARAESFQFVIHTLDTFVK
jgi:hypothetical protein